MLLDDSIDIYRGVWSNWERGGARVVTLSARDSQILTSFLSVFVTFASFRLWFLLSFAIHQLTESNLPSDGLHHQRRAILRNTSGAASASWSYVRQAWSWRGRANGAVRRSLQWTGFSGLFAVGFSLLAIFTASQVAIDDDLRLVMPTTSCGSVTVHDGYGHTGTGELLHLFNAKLAAAYVEECYNATNNGVRASCRLFPAPSIPWTSTLQEPCPFDPAICHANASVFQADTGLVNSRTFFGINARDSESVQYRKLVTCAPLKTEGYIPTLRNESKTIFNGSSGELTPSDVLYNYHYGRSLYMYSDNNITAQYVEHDFRLGFNKTGLAARRTISDGIPYHIETRHSYSGAESEDSWSPRNELNRTESDVSLIFIAANAMYTDQPLDDPVFSAHKKASWWPENWERYLFDNPFSPIACTEQYQLCNPENNKCTNLSGALGFAQQDLVNDLAEWVTELDFNLAQRAVSQRLYKQAMTSMTAPLEGRGSTALLATLRAFGTYQSALSHNHWLDEVTAWFNTSLAMDQLKVYEFAVPRNQRWSGLSDSKLVKEVRPGTGWMCETQLTAVTNGTVNFGEKSLILVFLIGTIVILISFVAEDVVGALQKRWHIGEHARALWIQDGTLQLQRLALQQAELGTWSGTENIVPVTELNEEFQRYGSTETINMMVLDKQEVSTENRSASDVLNYY